ncbi:MAG: 4-alpha-glucanotransferase [Chloroflexi bacterium]|nr:4-alpha-glucanotransferase [Chloroflexota bacterium]
MAFERASGILLHPTSLPGAYGIGSLGDTAYRFIDFLSETKQQLWQVLPLGPTGYGDSPYQCFSAFAGNPLLINLEYLVEKGLLPPEDTQAGADHFPAEYVDYGHVITHKTSQLARAFEQFRRQKMERADYDAFCEEQAGWLDDFALFMALKAEQGGGSWVKWPKELVQRDAVALEAARERLADSIAYHKFTQWIFFEQWTALKRAANDKGIKIIGDLPIFVAHDSADVWANPDLFYLDDLGNPTSVAGVPPDYFSATGQRWGNPLYRWDVMKTRGYSWWLSRFKQMLTLVDIVRIDHFRGFQDYWEIPADEPTAVNGKWVPGPRDDFFNAIRDNLGELPIIAEDLGLITRSVTELRKRFDLPGMAVLQFAFAEDSTNAFLPHNLEPNTVVYTGTHDNETTAGWFFRADTAGTTVDVSSLVQERHYARQYAKILVDSEVHWDFIRLAFQSVGVFAIVPMQDVLGLGNDARMNFPSSERGNWQWRMREEHLTDEIKRRLTELTTIYGRHVGGNYRQEPHAPNEDEHPAGR